MGKPTLSTVSLAGSIIHISIILAVLVSSLELYAASPASSQHLIPSRYIVVFFDYVDTDKAANELKRRFNISDVFRYRHALRGMAVKMPMQLVDWLAADPRVAYIEQDGVMRTAAQTLPTGINRIDAEENPAAHIDGKDVLTDRIDVDIAILDTGIDLDHPDLNVFRYAYCHSQGCNDNDPDANDVNGHGSHVAGIAGAIDNSIDVVGVAPGARLWAVKVIEDYGFGSTSQVIAGVDYVTQHASDIEVTNISLTGDGSSQALDDAISAAISAGVVFTLAAGNDSAEVSTVFPAGHPQAITVSAFEDYDGIPGGLSGNTQDDTFADFSNYGAGVDIMAPGQSILSTWAGGNTTTKSGTSMAAPHVAGAAALYLNQNPGAAPSSVKTYLVETGNYTPCANSADGTCADNRDGVQEPLLMYKNPASGDINGDRLVDVRDLQLGLQAILGYSVLDNDQLRRGDVAPLVGGMPESDGEFNLGDYVAILRKVIGNIAF